MDCSPPGSSIHGIFQARILEWVAISFSSGSSQPRDQTLVSRIAGRLSTISHCTSSLPATFTANTFIARASMALGNTDYTGTLTDLIGIFQFSSVAQSCPTLCDPMNCSAPGLPVHHQLPECTQTHVHQVSDAIQPSHPLSSPSPPAPNSSQHQSLFQ